MRVIDFFDKSASVNADRDLVVSDTGSVTYGHAREASMRLAAAFQVDGLQRGDGVGILAPNTASAFIGMLGLWRAGAAWLPINPYSSITSSIEVMNEVGCKYLLLHPVFAEYLDVIRAGVPTLVRVISLEKPIAGCDHIEEFLAQADGVAFEDWGDPWGNPDDVCGYLSSGGTTGTPKAIVHTNRVWSTMIQTCTRYWPTPEHPVNLMFAPITHAAGVMAVVMSSVGGTIIVQDGFDVNDVLDTIAERGVTHAFVPPTAFYAMVSEQRERPRDCSSLQMLLITSAPTAPEKFALGVQTFGPCIASCWGQAEAPFLLSYLSPEDLHDAVIGRRSELLQSCGKVTFASQVVAMADDGEVLKPGEPGELVARGPLVSTGYLHKPEETTAVQKYGWHHTGDIGRVDENGYVYIVDRLKDMIITGGFNVYPAEVEAVVLAMPEVRQCAVIGVPDGHWGERVTAVVVLEPAAVVEAQTIIAHVREALGPVKAPKEVVFESSLPHTAVGKIDKRAIRRQHAALAPSQN